MFCFVLFCLVLFCFVFFWLVSKKYDVNVYKQQKMDAIRNGVNNFTARSYEKFNNIRENVENTVKNVGETVSNVTNNVTERLEEFGPKNQGNNSFMNSNSIVAKFTFIILIFLVFLLLCTLGTSMIGYLTQTSSSPYIIYGMLDGTNALVISQDPSKTDSIPITRSNDQRTGMEFSWSIWLLLTDNSSKKTYQNIFNKGDSNYDNGISQVNNGPGLYVSSLINNENNLHIIMDTVDINIGQAKIDVNGVPFNKWFLVVIRLENKILDVYVNGTITNRYNMKSVPKQNYNDINICQNGGFVGQLSNLRYYNYALSSFAINNIVMRGPNLNPSKLDSSRITATDSPYFLSSTWYSKQE